MDINAGKRVRRDVSGVNGVFVHVVSAPVIKRVARTRAGALATSAREAEEWARFYSCMPLLWSSY